MKFLFKIIVAFLIIFNWRISYIYNSVFLAVIITSAFYIFTYKKLLFTYFFQYYNSVIIIGTIAIALVIFTITVFHGTVIFCSIQKRMWVELLMLGAMIYALPLFIEGKESTAFEEVCVIICYAFALQGLIHLTAYLYEPLGNYLFEMKPEGIKEKALSSKYNVDRFRLYCLSGIVFVELVAAYGVAFMLFFRLQLNNRSHPYLRGYVSYVILFFMITGTALAGRTGFVGLGLGIFLWTFFSFNRIITFIHRNIFNIIFVSMVVILAYNFLLTSKQRNMFNEEVFPFAFEWYYNYRDYGTLNVASLDATESQYYYLRDETLLKGHGETFGRGEALGYPQSDAGYMNNLIFGGIPYLICLIIYQSLYFIRPISIAQRKNTYSNRADIALFVLFFMYMFLLSYKTTAIGTLHIVETLLIAAGSSYVIRYYAPGEQNE